MVDRSNLRVARLFGEDGRSLTVAMDHARAFDTITALADVESVVGTVLAAGADAVLLPPGALAKAGAAAAAAGVWMSVDSTPQTAAQLVELALRLGADGIKCECYPWVDRDRYPQYSAAESLWWGMNLNAVSLANECRKWGLPLIAEAVPGGWDDETQRSPERLAAACRVVSECGPDFVKAFYTGDRESFRRLVDNCLVPVVVLGGARKGSELEVLRMVRDAIDAGAVGIMMGRNIWDHENVAGMTAALAAIVHDDAAADTAVRLIR